MKKLAINSIFIFAMLFMASCQENDGGSGSTANPTADDFTVLKFSDEFNTNGAPDLLKWTYDLGTGTNGWGNEEKQNYTNDSKNIRVEDGNLIITAIKETSGNQSYSSARIKTEGKYSFKYGKVEFRAKLPIGIGTWPAIWSLGANYQRVSWPVCGEIDFMEHVGKEQNKIFGSLHYPGNSGGNAVTGTKLISNASTEFHVYKVIWNANKIRFYVDDLLYKSAPNTSTLPFNLDFFIIMNVAMGGSFGGPISPEFTQSSMFVDYIRVYQ
jgi:beta-glucanase (GH16 family)